MTSGNFEIVPLTSILVNRDDRQRRELRNIEELAESIRANGLINPIVVTRDMELVAGERRYTAHQYLGFDSIAVQYAEDLPSMALHLIELEENIRREDLDWQDHVNAVSRFHQLKTEEAAQEGESWSQDRTAEELNMSQAHVNRHLLVKKALDAGVKEVVEAPKLSTAANFAQRQAERKKSSLLKEVRQQTPRSPAESGDPDLTLDDLPPPERFAEVLNRDFKIFSEEVLTNPYNFIHCDFPYGVNAGDTKGQSGAKSFGGYADSPDIYFDLLKTFCDRLDNFTAASAHLMFWFSMDYYTETLEALRAAGWSVSPFPLVWYKSDNSGILPDSNRGPRRIYETAFFGSKGDRKIVRAVGNCTPSPATKQFHMSEKPLEMLEHFFRMIVDDTTLLLDPTCGSGNAVKVAEQLGANWATGLELNPEYVELAKENLELD